MDMFGSFFGKSYKGNEECGLCNGYLPGQIGIWAVWGSEKELLRVTLTVHQPSGAELPPFSYSFLPSLIGPVYQSLALPHVVLELLRGNQVHDGHLFELKWFLHGGAPQSLKLEQTEFEKAVHAKAAKAPAQAGSLRSTLIADTDELAKMPLDALKAKSDAIRKSEAEKKRLEEEQRSKAALELEAKKKAAEAAAKATQAAAPTASRVATAGDPKTPTLPGCKTVIIYGSSTGNTKNVAEVLKETLSSVDYVKNVTEITPADFAVPENLILGIPTWHIGELQDDWAAMLPLFEQVNPNVSGKKVAIFGLGDQKGYPDTYVDAIQMLWEPFEKRGAKLFGWWPTKGYEFQKSKAVKDDKFMGLVIDIENQDHLSDGRIKAWAAQIKAEMGL